MVGLLRKVGLYALGAVMLAGGCVSPLEREAAKEHYKPTRVYKANDSLRLPHTFENFDEKWELDVSGIADLAVSGELRFKGNKRHVGKPYQLTLAGRMEKTVIGEVAHTVAKLFSKKARETKIPSKAALLLRGLYNGDFAVDSSELKMDAEYPKKPEKISIDRKFIHKNGKTVMTVDQHQRRKVLLGEQLVVAPKRYEVVDGELVSKDKKLDDSEPKPRIVCVYKTEVVPLKSYSFRGQVNDPLFALSYFRRYRNVQQLYGEVKKRGKVVIPFYVLHVLQTIKLKWLGNNQIGVYEGDDVQADKLEDKTAEVNRGEEWGIQGRLAERALVNSEYLLAQYLHLKKHPKDPLFQHIHVLEKRILSRIQYIPYEMITLGEDRAFFEKNKKRINALLAYLPPDKKGRKRALGKGMLKKRIRTGPNKPPTVELTIPAVHVKPGNGVLFHIEAYDEDGHIIRYLIDNGNGGQEFAGGSVGSWGIVHWKPGVYHVFAQVMDNDGATTRSEPLTIHVAGNPVKGKIKPGRSVSSEVSKILYGVSFKNDPSTPIQGFSFKLRYAKPPNGFSDSRWPRIEKKALFSTRSRTQKNIDPEATTFLSRMFDIKTKMCARSGLFAPDLMSDDMVVSEAQHLKRNPPPLEKNTVKDWEWNKEKGYTKKKKNANNVAKGLFKGKKKRVKKPDAIVTLDKLTHKITVDKIRFWQNGKLKLKKFQFYYDPRTDLIYKIEAKIKDWPDVTVERVK